MKKLVLFLAVAFSVSLFSCGGHDNKAEGNDTAVVVEEAAVVEEAPVCDNDSCTAENCDSCTETPCEAAPEA